LKRYVTSEGEVPEGCLSEKIIPERNAENVIFFAPKIRLKRLRTGACGGTDAADRTRQRAAYSEAARLVRWPTAQHVPKPRGRFLGHDLPDAIGSDFNALDATSAFGDGVGNGLMWPYAE
jgi:hypothetical protein